jgi:hypothetical protein
VTEQSEVLWLIEPVGTAFRSDENQRVSMMAAELVASFFVTVMV